MAGARAYPGIVGLFLLAAACSTGAPPSVENAPATIRLTSPAFGDGQRVPNEFTCDARDLRPPLDWSGGPNAAEYAIAMVDTDADFVHWLLFGVPGTVHGVISGPLPNGAVEGANDFNKVGYGGPCPPSGDAPHHYEFTVYALSSAASGRLRAAATPDEFFRVIACCVVAKGTLVGTFSR